MRFSEDEKCPCGDCRMANVGRSFSAKRLEANMSICEVSLASGVSEAKIQGFEIGAVDDLSLLELLRLAGSLGISIDSIACETVH